MDKAEDTELQLAIMCTQQQESTERREKVQNHLQLKKKDLETELKAVNGLIKVNSVCLEKWRKLIASCKCLNKMPPDERANRLDNTDFTKARQQTQKERAESEVLLNQIIAEEEKELPAKRRRTNQSGVGGQIQTAVDNILPTPAQSAPQQETSTLNQILFSISSPTNGIISTTDITDFLKNAVKKGLIVSHESRSLTMDLGLHGLFEIKAQIESNVPRVLSATPLPTAIHSSQDTTTNTGSSTSTSNPQPTDCRKSTIYTPEFFRSVFGPDAGDGKLIIINRSTNPTPVFILPNGEMRRLTNFQMDAIQTYRFKSNAL